MGLITKLLLALFILLHIQDGSDAARILGLCPIASRSHFAMCGGLLRGLAARGHQVDVVSPFPMKKPPPNYRDISIAGKTGISVYNRSLEMAQGSTAHNIGLMVEMAGTKMCDLLHLPQLQRIIKNPPKKPPYDLVIHELFASECYLAFGRHLKVPVVVLVTSKLYDWMNQPLGNPPSTAFVPSILSQYDQRMSFQNRVGNLVESAYLRLEYWWKVVKQKEHVKEHFGIELEDISEVYKDVALTLVNTHPSFDFIRPMTPGVVEVGGLHVSNGSRPLSPNVQKFLDESEDGCVYFSLGSMVRIESFPYDTLKAIARSFARISPCRVLLKVTGNGVLPVALPGNVMTSRWFPQTRVLQHKNVKAFVTHCGLMSVQEAVTYGVPMVGVPIFSDQFLNQRLCVKHKIMVPVDYKTLTVESFTAALQVVLKNPTYRENSKRLAKKFVDRPMSAMDTAIYWIEYVLRNGNVLRSPADELWWYELELLDVYIFLTCLTIFIVGFLFSRGGIWFTLSKESGPKPKPKPKPKPPSKLVTKTSQVREAARRRVRRRTRNSRRFKM